MGIEENTTLVRRFVEEAWNRGDLAIADATHAPTYGYQAPSKPRVTRSREDLRQQITRLRADFPALRITLDDVIAAGDKVVVRYSLTGNRRYARQGGRHHRHQHLPDRSRAGSRVLGARRQPAPRPPSSATSRLQTTANPASGPYPTAWGAPRRRHAGRRPAQSRVDPSGQITTTGRPSLRASATTSAVLSEALVDVHVPVDKQVDQGRRVPTPPWREERQHSFSLPTRALYRRAIPRHAPRPARRHASAWRAWWR